MKRVILLLGMLFIVQAAAAGENDDAVGVPATAETEPVAESGDAADDIAIWIHPTDPALSAIIGTDKTRDGGLIVYNLDGSIHQQVEIGRINNVDLRYNFLLEGEPVTLVAATNRSDDSLIIYRMNEETRALENVAARAIISDVEEVYGFCMYVSPNTGDYYAFINSEDTGEVEQWRLFDGGGRVDAELVREFEVGSQTEGCAADDEFGVLYIGEESDGIWKYSAEPDGGDERVLVDSTGDDGHLEDDVEGLTLYYAADGVGYLIASSQGSDDYAVYSRDGDNEYLGRFAIERSADVDGTSGTDGIDVTNAALGAAFPSGVFVAQDGRNTHPDANQNFKLVSWSDIARALDLVVDTEFDPRR